MQGTLSYHDDHDDDNINDGDDDDDDDIDDDHDDYVGVVDVKSRDDGYIDDSGVMNQKIIIKMMVIMAMKEGI